MKWMFFGIKQNKSRNFTVLKNKIMAVIFATDADFNNYITTNQKVIVKYFADWCGTCKLISPKFKRLSSDERFENVVFLEVNAEESPEARKLANVDNLPFFATFKNGDLVKNAATSKEDLIVSMITELN